MKVFLLCGALVAGIGITATAGAAPATCGKPPPRIEINLTKERVAYDHTTSQDSIATMARNSTMESHFQIVGLYRPKINTTSSFKYSYFTRANKRCYFANEIKVDIAVARTVFIAKEYKKGSCRYRVTERHEKKHVRYDEDLLRAYRLNMENRLKRTFNANGFTNAKALKTALQTDINGALGDFKKRRDRLHGKIDNSKNYKKESRSCKW